LYRERHSSPATMRTTATSTRIQIMASSRDGRSRHATAARATAVWRRRAIPRGSTVDRTRRRGRSGPRRPLRISRDGRRRSTASRTPAR
jgi:hypothetical protein